MLTAGLAELEDLEKCWHKVYDPFAAFDENILLEHRFVWLSNDFSCKGTKRSRGAHNRSDYPERNESYEKHIYTNLQTDKSVYLGRRRTNDNRTHYSR